MSSETKPEGFQLVAGFTVFNEKSSETLLTDLLRFRAEAQLSTLVVCCDSEDAPSILQWVERFRVDGVKVRYVPRIEIRRSADRGEFGRYYASRDRQTGIAFFRTMLHHYLYRESRRFPNPVVWILDDDVRPLESLFHRPPSPGRSPFVETILGLKEEGAAVAVGRISGDPPVPGASMIRTQLLDLDFSLRALRNPSFEGVPPRNRATNTERFPDFHYDLTLRHYGHLETPWFYSSENGSTDRFSLLEEMLERVPEIARGANIFRQIPDARVPEPVTPSPLTRGGNTLVLDISCLRDYPNIAPRLGGVSLRRGDTLWTILNGASGASTGRKVVPTNLTVRQERSDCEGSIFDTRSLVADIMGGAFTRTVDEFLKKDKGERPLRFSPTTIEQFLRAFDERLRERLELLRMNSWRIVGLVRSIRAQFRDAARAGGQELAIVQRHQEAIEGLLSRVEEAFSPEAIETLAEGVLGYPRTELEEFLQHLEEYCESYREQLPSWKGPVDLAHAVSFLNSHFGDRGFRPLAAGLEGFVLTDGERAYKYFYDGIHNFCEGQLEFVLGACSLNHLSWAKHINHIEEAIVDDSQVVFVSQLMLGQPYRGGSLQGILEMLRECRRANIVLSNVSPENLVESQGALVQVDLGRSVEPFDEQEFRQMCKRAFLTYKWSFRSDIKVLMRRATTDDSLPELAGFEQFLAALEEKTDHDVTDAILFDAVGKSEPKRILDYGCGNGQVGDKLVLRGVTAVTAYDVTRAQFEDRWHPDGVEFVDREGLEQLRRSGSLFDVVLCNLVLCSVDDPTATEIVTDLRSLVDPNGVLVLGICNPFGLDTEESEVQVRMVPEGMRYSDHFAYQKFLKRTRNSRTDFHRPFSWYRMVLKRAGFEVIEVIEVPTVDVPRLTPGSDFMVLRLRPEPSSLKQNLSKDERETLVARTVGKPSYGGA